MAGMLDEPSALGGDRQINWSLKLASPFLMFELHSRTSHIPEMLWLDNGIKDVLNGTDGTVTLGHISDSNAIGDRNRYLYTILRARAACFEYSIMTDPQAFRRPLHTTEIKNVPMGFFLKWNAGLIFGSDLAVTFLGVSIKPILFKSGRRNGFQVSMAPIKFEAYYSKLNHWHFSLKTSLRIPDPFAGKGFKNEY
jgi:hypothetical protein